MTCLLSAVAVGHKHMWTTRWQCLSVHRCSKCSGALSSFEVFLFFLVGKRGNRPKQRSARTHTQHPLSGAIHTFDFSRKLISKEKD